MTFFGGTRDLSKGIFRSFIDLTFIDALHSAASACMRFSNHAAGGIINLGDQIHLNVALAVAQSIVNGVQNETNKKQTYLQPVRNVNVIEPAPIFEQSTSQILIEGVAYTNYRSIVDAYSVRDLAVGIASRYPEDSAGRLLRAAALFEYVKTNVQYVSDPIDMSRGRRNQLEYAARPDVTITVRGGDCEDQAILMASLLSATGIKNRMHCVVNGNNEGHLLTEVAIDSAISDKIVSLLNNFYNKVRRPTGPRVYYWFNGDGEAWIVVDTTRNYVGDYSSLMADGFIDKLSDNSIRWHQLQFTC